MDQAVARNTTAGRRVLRGGLVLLLVVALLALLLVVGVRVGPVALAIGFCLATIPAPLYVYIALRIDRFEPEPVRLLGWSFFWGATGATFIAFVLNTAGTALVGSEFGKATGELYGGSISAPVVEEGAKAAILFAIFRRRRAEFDGALDGLVYAAMVGLGFAMTENVLYYGRAAVEGGVALPVIVILRGVLSPFAHPVFTAMTGLGLGIAAHALGGPRRWLAPAAGLLGAMLLHSLWNTSTLGGGAGFFGVYFLIMVPIFFALIVVVRAALRREASRIATYLQPEVAGGVLGSGDLMVLTALRERRRLRRAARRDGGPAKQATAAWVMTATELAFLRDRVQRGLPLASAAPAAEDAALAARLRELRPALGPSANAAIQAAAERAARMAQAAASFQAVPPGRPATEWEPLTPPAAAPAQAAAPGQAPTQAVTPGQAAAPAQPAVPAGRPATEWAPLTPQAPQQPAAAAPAPAAWYQDPWAQARWRWWDGAQWTYHTAN
jgi:RsiW-degrading membrane proteinase PrsW (M82 family)